MVFRKRKTNPAVETGGNERSTSKRSRILVIIIVLATIIGGVLAWLAYRQGWFKQDSGVVTSRCESHYAQYGIMEASGDAKAFQDSAKQIESLEGYATDTDCVFMLTRYEVLKGDTILARYFFDLFSKAYDQTGFGKIPVEKKDELISSSRKVIEEREAKFKEMAAQRGIPQDDFEKYRQDYIKNREMPWNQ